jgi:y4mF family transcriptional regulator
MMSDMKEVGAFIANERKRQGITQLELSQAADVGRRFIVELENGKETIHAGKLLKVLATLGIDFSLTAPEGV